MSSHPGPLGQLLATELRAEMGRQNRSRRWLAEQVHAPHNTVSRWIAGETSPPLDALDSMCAALGIDMAGLIGLAKYRLEAAQGRAVNGVLDRRGQGIPDQGFRRRLSDMITGMNAAIA